MCGIAGFIEFSAAEPSVSEQILRKMSDVIIHRGPDDEGHWISPNRRAGFAFRRLAIVDLSPAGHQPMTTPDGRFTIVFNGEIYNHLELRKELEAKGYRYKSRSDTETILFGFQEWGVEILQKMVGMWGLAIWDNQTNELFCARDRIGIKPLYFSHQNGRFFFASEIKSILQHPSVSAEMNLDELPNYLTFCSSSEHSTLFKKIHKLPAGCFLRLKSDGNMKIERFWSPLKENTPNTTLTEPEICSKIFDLLRTAVKDRMMSDVPFGVFLSGGVDSSINVALMAELMSRPVDTFTVGFKDLEKYNELEFARKVAKIFGTNHHEIFIDHNDALSVYEKLAWHTDEPNGDATCIPAYFVSKLTRESGTIVAQGGEGSDEQFAGYPWMLRDVRFFHSYWKFYTGLPQIFRKGIFGVAKPLFQLGRKFLALDYLRRGTDGDEMYWGGAIEFTPSHLAKLLSEDSRHLAKISSEMPARLHREALRRKPDADYLQRIAFVELSHRLPELLLMRMDKATMANSIEARVPFLDHRLVEFTMTIPEAMKIPASGETKYLLKKGAETVLPKEIIYRKKQGFVAPMNEWLRKPLAGFCESKILGSRIMKEGIFNETEVRNYLQLHTSGKQNLGRNIHLLLNLALWYDRFIG